MTNGECVEEDVEGGTLGEGGVYFINIFPRWEVDASLSALHLDDSLWFCLQT